MTLSLDTLSFVLQIAIGTGVFLLAYGGTRLFFALQNRRFSRKKESLQPKIKQH